LGREVDVLVEIAQRAHVGLLLDKKKINFFKRSLLDEKEEAIGLLER